MNTDTQLRVTPRIIWTDHREYDALDCYQSGFRDGRDGIKFYPCSEWDLVAGDAVRGNRTRADKAYADGYRAGRLAWKEATGAFPRSGSDHLDE